jgi:RHS repeat-associated protein
MSGSTVVNTIATNYNADGEVTSTGDNYSDYAFAYSGQGMVSSVDNAGTPGAPHVVLSSQHNTQGDRTSLAATLNGTPDFINSYGFEALSRLREIDQQGQAGGNAVAQKSIYLKLDPIGDVTEIDRSNSVYAGPQQTSPGWTIVSYDATTGLLDEINHITAGTSIDDLTYTHDTLARISTFSSIDGTATYGYDNTSQIVSAAYTTATGGHQPANVSFTWDANGNNAATGNVVSANNEVTNDGTFTYQFDADGNRTVRTRVSSDYASDYKTTYAWDYRNRLTDVEFFDNNNVLTKHVHYVYSVYDDLIEEDIDPNGGGRYTTIEQFALDVNPKLPVQVLSLSNTIDPSAPDDGLLEFVNGQLANRILNGPSPSGVADVLFADGAVGSLFEPDVTNWFLVNNQGSPTDVVDSSGDLIDHNVYSPFGQVVYVSNAGVHQLQGFSGGFADPNTGLIKFGDPWYDPATGTWLSQNPEGFAAGDANLYRYAGNSPTDGIDPAGLSTQYVPGIASGQPTGDMSSGHLASGTGTNHAETPVGGSTWIVSNSNSSTVNPMTTVAYAQGDGRANSQPKQPRAPTPLYGTPYGNVNQMRPTGQGSRPTPLYTTPYGNVNKIRPTGQDPHNYYSSKPQPKQRPSKRDCSGNGVDMNEALRQWVIQGGDLNDMIRDEVLKQELEQSPCPSGRKPRPQR